MSDIAPAPHPRSHRRRCPFRVVELMPRRFAIVERSTDVIVAAGFESYEAAWAFIANRLDGRA